MFKKNMKKTLALFLTMGVLLTACGGTNDSNGGSNTSSGNSSQSTTDSAEKPAEGVKSVTIATSTAISTLDNSVADLPNDLSVIYTMHDQLYGRQNDGTVDLQLAESVDISDDHLVYTFHLRDAEYSNGEPIKAEDFVYSWQRLVNPDTGSEYAWFAGAAGIANADEIAYNGGDINTLGVKAIDEKTLEVTLDREVPYFKYIVSTVSFAPIQKTFGEAQGDQYGLSPDNIISSGPYIVDEWVVGSSEIKLKKNENYWNKDSVEVDELIFQNVPDIQAGILAYEKGDIDVVALSGEQAYIHKDDKEADLKLNAAIKYLYINHDNEYIANKNFRLAINYALNKSDITEGLLKNGSVVADYIVPDEFAPDDNGVPYHQAVELNYLSYDPEKAEEYWAAAKSELGKEDFSLEYLYDDREESKNIAQYIKSALESSLPGLTIELHEVPYAACWDEEKAGHFDLAFSMWGADYVDPSIYFDCFVSDSDYNLGNWNSPKYDELIKEANANASDYSRRYSIYNEAEQLIIDEVGLIPVFQISQITLIRDGFEVPYNQSYLYRSINIK